MCVNQGTPTSVTYVIQVLQMLEASRNASCFADTIEYAIFAHASLIAFNFFFVSKISNLTEAVQTKFKFTVMGNVS